MELTTAPRPSSASTAGACSSRQKRDGRPQLSNIAYAVGDDGVIRISITADRAKYKNLQRTPLASLHVTREDFYAYAVLEADVELSAVAAAPDDAAVDELVDVLPRHRRRARRLGRLPRRDGHRPPRRRPPQARPTPTACCPLTARPRPTRPATERALGGRPLSQATGRWDRVLGLRPSSTHAGAFCRRRTPPTIRRRGPASCGPDGRHDLAGTIAVRVPREAEDDPALEDELVLPWAVPLEDVAALVVSPIELDGDLQLRVGQVDLRELPSVRIVDAVVDDRLRQSVLDQQREHQKLEVAVCDLVPVDASGDRLFAAS